jgi:1,6-anhydro-N-acetylmuramate kinase
MYNYLPAFGFFAQKTLAGLSSNLPSVTGACGLPFTIP